MNSACALVAARPQRVQPSGPAVDDAAHGADRHTGLFDDLDRLQQRAAARHRVLDQRHAQPRLDRPLDALAAPVVFGLLADQKGRERASGLPAGQADADGDGVGGAWRPADRLDIVGQALAASGVRPGPAHRARG